MNPRPRSTGDVWMEILTGPAMAPIAVFLSLYLFSRTRGWWSVLALLLVALGLAIQIHAVCNGS